MEMMEMMKGKGKGKEAMMMMMMKGMKGMMMKGGKDKGKMDMMMGMMQQMMGKGKGDMGKDGGKGQMPEGPLCREDFITFRIHKKLQLKVVDISDGDLWHVGNVHFNKQGDEYDRLKSGGTVAESKEPPTPPFSGWGPPSPMVRQHRHVRLVDKVKQLQKMDQTAKQLWWDYCDMHGGGTRDPIKHPCEFLEVFISQYEAMVAADPTIAKVQEFPQVDLKGLAPPSDKQVDELKQMQRSDPRAKEAWWFYCDKAGNGTKDPRKHEAAFVENFMASYKEGSLSGAEFDEWKTKKDEPPEKRRRQTEPRQSFVPWSADGTPPPGVNPNFVVDPMKEALMNRIKNYQKIGDTQKQEWWYFCDQVAQGKYDPARHDVNSLEQFITQYRVPQAPLEDQQLS